MAKVYVPKENRGCAADVARLKGLCRRMLGQLKTYRLLICMSDFDMTYFDSLIAEAEAVLKDGQ